MLTALGRAFRGPGQNDVVDTTMPFLAGPDQAWEAIVTYEEVREAPPWYLRLLFPLPLGTEGDKSRPGADVLCRYDTGNLIKRIRKVDPPRLLEFDVVDQRLGIEDCVTALGGSYRIRLAAAERSQVELTTRYVSRLHPRWLWRPLEHLIGHRFHRHILEEMRARVPAPASKRIPTCQT